MFAHTCFLFCFVSLFLFRCGSVCVCVCVCACLCWGGIISDKRMKMTFHEETILITSCRQRRCRRVNVDGQLLWKERHGLLSLMRKKRKGQKTRARRETRTHANVPTGTHGRVPGEKSRVKETRADFGGARNEQMFSGKFLIITYAAPRGRRCLAVLNCLCLSVALYGGGKNTSGWEEEAGRQRERGPGGDGEGKEGEGGGGGKERAPRAEERRWMRMMGVYSLRARRRDGNEWASVTSISVDTCSETLLFFSSNLNHA